MSKFNCPEIDVSEVSIQEIILLEDKQEIIWDFQKLENE
jgi:hypothetical protein